MSILLFIPIVPLEISGNTIESLISGLIGAEIIILFFIGLIFFLKTKKIKECDKNANKYIIGIVIVAIIIILSILYFKFLFPKKLLVVLLSLSTLCVLAYFNMLELTNKK